MASAVFGAPSRGTYCLTMHVLFYISILWLRSPYLSCWVAWHSPSDDTECHRWHRNHGHRLCPPTSHCHQSPPCLRITNRPNLYSQRIHTVLLNMGFVSTNRPPVATGHLVHDSQQTKFMQSTFTYGFYLTPGRDVCGSRTGRLYGVCV